MSKPKKLTIRQQPCFFKLESDMNLSTHFVAAFAIGIAFFHNAELALIVSIGALLPDLDREYFYAARLHGQVSDTSGIASQLCGRNATVYRQSFSGTRGSKPLFSRHIHFGYGPRS
jgi:hypothetical protein